MIKTMQTFWDNFLIDHPTIILQAISVYILLHGIYLILAAIKNWDEFKPNSWFERDDNWQGISRIWGNKWARSKGFCAGVFVLVPLGVFLIYVSIIKPLLK